MFVLKCVYSERVHSFIPERPRSVSVPVDVQLSVVGKIVVNDERNLRNIQTSGPNVCGDQHSTAREKQQKDYHLKHFWDINLLPVDCV